MPGTITYRPSRRATDEAFAADGGVRPLYGDLLDELATQDLGARSEAVRQHLAGAGVSFGGDAGGWPFVVDPIPRLVAAEEWDALAVGLARRAHVLEAFVADMHGARACVADGVVPADVLDGCPFFEPDLVGLPDPPTARIAVAGMDLVKGDDGAFLVLEDNCRTPSGAIYALAAREAVAGLHDLAGPPRDFGAALRSALRSALDAAMPIDAPDGALAVLMSDGPANTAWYEHRRLAELVDVPLLLTADVRRDGDRLVRRADGAPIGVVYRRTDVDRLRDDAGEPTSLGELMLPALRAGTLSVLNGFGTGVADDKRVHAYVDRLSDYYLGEPALVHSVPTLDLAEPAALEQALDRAAELVLKPRDGHGGHGVVIGPAASDDELGRVRAEVRARPQGWIAQDVVALSTHPTVVDGELVPRHVDLRPFAYAVGPRRWEILPGGLTRVALAEGELIVNSSRGGGGKDTWVVA